MPPNAILLAVTGPLAEPTLAEFRAQAPERDVRALPNPVGDRGAVAYAAVLKPPRGALADLPNLRAIFSFTAGVDHTLGDPGLPDVPLARIDNPDLSMRMTEYVVLHALMAHRRQRVYDAQQRERVWLGHHQPAASEVAVGVMGLGAIGMEAAAVLARVGFRVAGWSRTAKRLPGIECHHGEAGLETFLSRTEILVCLLPHTPATDGLLDLPLFRKLKRDGALGGAYLINAARGKLQVDAGVIAGLDEGALAGATLDVFAAEPLAPDSPLWRHPGVTVTPHNAGDLSPRALVRGALDQIARMERGEPPDNVVDRGRGY